MKRVSISWKWAFAVAVIVWYVVDGRWSYFQYGHEFRRVDRLFGTVEAYWDPDMSDDRFAPEWRPLSWNKSAD